ncbi:hypothetical protein BC833DRAFT_589302 [Globomyces pollinis-pini]|nr:hypothetical protein BC833DRAFT_589302 [Globomyces pollinis-pini]
MWKSIIFVAVVSFGGFSSPLPTPCRISCIAGYECKDNICIAPKACGGGNSTACETGYVCNQKNVTEIGSCVKKQQPCGGINNKRCKSGFSCQLIGSVTKPNRKGVCVSTPTVCGGILGQACDGDEYCRYPNVTNSAEPTGVVDSSNSTVLNDGLGLCIPKPESCDSTCSDGFSCVNNLCVLNKGTCGIKYGKKCKSGFECQVKGGVNSSTLTVGKCVPKPKECGGFIGTLCVITLGKPCEDGYQCEYVGSPIISDRLGICVPIKLDGCAAITCPVGQICEPQMSIGMNQTYNCVPDGKTPCGGFLGLPCNDGYHCQLNNPTVADDMGVCIKDSEGTTTVPCGGLLGLTCVDGYHCHLNSTIIADDLGVCVKDS